MDLQERFETPIQMANIELNRYIYGVVNFEGAQIKLNVDVG